MWFFEEMSNVNAERFLRISNWLTQKIEILQTPILWKNFYSIGRLISISWFELARCNYLNISSASMPHNNLQFSFPSCKFIHALSLKIISEFAEPEADS